MSVVVLSSLLLVLPVGCTSKGDDDAARPSECGESEDSKQADSKECAEAEFDRTVTDDAPEELKELSPEKRLELARDLCDLATEVTAAGGPRPVRSTLLSSAAEKWDLSAASVDDVAAAAEPICPDEFATLESLPVTNGPVRVELEVGGSGAVTVSYTNSDGEVAEETAFAPWKLPIVLQNPVDIQLKASPREGNEDGKLTCIIRLDESALAESGQSGNDQVSCSVAKAQLVSAANEG